jgi:F-type H+-transporting ATPase subunit b
MQLPDLSLLLVMVLFWATYAVLRAFVFKPLGAILEEREKKSATATEALARAVENEKETLAAIDRRLTEARREALAARQASRNAANASRQALLEAAREKARLATTAAQTKLDGEVAAARAELAKTIRTTAGEIASRALGRRIA